MDSGEASAKRFSYMRTNLLFETIKFFYSLLFLLINFLFACASVDAPLFSLSSGSEYGNDLNRLFGFSSGLLITVLIRDYIPLKSEAVILLHRRLNHSFEDPSCFAELSRCWIWFFDSFNVLLNSATLLNSIFYRGWLGQHGSLCNANTRPSFWFSFKAPKARPSVWKARPCVVQQALGGVFRYREFMKIWSVKSTV